MSESAKKRWENIEERKRQSDATKGEKNPMYGKCGKDSPMYGKKRSEETKKKLSEAHKGLHTGDKNPMYGKRGKDSPMYGKVWINNGVEAKLVYPSEIPNGYTKGRLKVNML